MNYDPPPPSFGEKKLIKCDKCLSSVSVRVLAHVSKYKMPQRGVKSLNKQLGIEMNIFYDKSELVYLFKVVV